MQKENSNLSKMRFNLINSNIPFYFPFDNKEDGVMNFSNSMWKYLTDAIDKIKEIPTVMSPFFDEETGDELGLDFDDKEYIKSDAINYMSGAMLVLLWVHMEYFIKMLMPYLCVLGTNNAKLDDGIQIFENEYIYKENEINLSRWCKLFRSISEKKSEKKKYRKTFNFSMFKKAFKKAIKEKSLGSIKEYQRINDVRLLNNIFKHLKGTYNAKQKECKELSNSIKKKLGIKDDTYITDIQYQNIDIREQIKYCHDFLLQVIKLITRELKNKNLI